MDPDDGAAPGTPCLTFVAPAILWGGANDDQLGPAALMAQLAPSRRPQGFSILRPVHRVVRGSGLTNQGQILPLCDHGICELQGEDT